MRIKLHEKNIDKALSFRSNGITIKRFTRFYFYQYNNAKSIKL
jgi:hypothetical protein